MKNYLRFKRRDGKRPALGLIKPLVVTSGFEPVRFSE